MAKAIISGAVESAIGAAPYGDRAEISGKPTVDLVTDRYREFLATDARSILIVLHPHHYNFILNPAMRVDSHGWSVTGAISAPSPASIEVVATTDAVANSETMASARASGTDGQTVNVTETVDKPGLSTAFARWGAPTKSPISYNLLTANQASLETNTTGWTAETNCTIARTTAQAADGTASLAITTTATATTSVITTIGTGGIPVVPGRSYTATAAVRAATTARSPTLAFAWYTSAGTYISKTGGWLMLEVNNAWTTGTTTQVAPPTAAYAAVNVSIPSTVAAEVHYIDKIGFWEGVNGSWSLPGVPLLGVQPTRISDLAGGGNDLVFATGANAPVVLPWTGKNYLSTYTGYTSGGNYLDGIMPNVPATASLSWTIETTNTLQGNNFILMHSSTTNGQVQVLINSAGAFVVNTWVASAIKTLTWAGAVTVNTKKTYRVELTTTGAELFIDDVTQTLKTFGATRVPAANTISQMFITDSTASPTFYRIHAFNLYGAQVFDPVKANFDATFTTVINTGTQGGTWTIRRATTGHKAALVTEPLLQFGGVQSMQTDPMSAMPVGTFIMSLRHYPDSSLNSLSRADASAAVGFQQQILTSNKYQFKMGAASWTSPSPIAAGPHTIGITYDGSTAQVYIDGAIQSGFAATGYFLNNLVFIGSATWSSMHWAGAALWDRVLTAGEVATASSELAGIPTTNPEVSVHSYVLATGSVIPKPNVPFPVTGSLVGYQVWNPSLSPLDPTSWVGQSFRFSGAGKIEFNDPKGTRGVYVGTLVTDKSVDEFYEPGRGSGQWTYSAYVMGPCRARLTMEAYASTDPQTAYSPAKYRDLPTIADPRVAPYDAAKPEVLDGDVGNVWLLKDPPFYVSLGRLPRITGPSTYVPPTVVPPYILDAATADVWKAKDPKPASAPYYVKVGTYVDKAPPWDPTTTAPVENYIRYVDAVDPVDNESIWEALSPATREGLSYYEDTGSGPPLGTVRGDWIDVPGGEWKRLMIQTGVRYAEGEDNSFLGCGWIDAWLDFEEAEGAYFSAFMLDPTEYPVAQYFDGSMTEDAVVDDFLWATSAPEHVNNSVSEYYYDRLTRVRFLQEHLRDHVPAGRPYQIFMGSYDDPYVPPTDASSRAVAHRKI